MNKRLFLRCDADSHMGLGHYYRQCSLAQAAQERGKEVTMVMHQTTPDALLKALEHAGISTELSQHPRASKEERDWLISLLDAREDTLVLDGYHFEQSYIESLQGEARELVIFDDDGSQRASVDVLVNLNLGAEALDYSMARAARRLLGVQYTLLRPQFRELRASVEQARHAPNAPVQNALITMGGGDVTEFVMTAVRGLDDAGFEGMCHILLGATASQCDALSALLDACTFDAKIHVQIEEVAKLMSIQDLAICSAGGTSWELCCMGVPMMQAMLFDNQKVVIENLVRLGISASLGTRETFDEASVSRTFTALNNNPAERARMSHAGMTLVDGYGAHRLLGAIGQ